MTQPEFVPRDVVPRNPVTRECLLKLNASVGETVVVIEPGALLEDYDGSPLGVGPSTASKYVLNPPIVDRASVLAAGLSPADLPNLRIIDIDKEKEQ